jgi:SAM-dependent methyltransferase
MNSSDHYVGTEGQKYFSLQRLQDRAPLKGKIRAARFQPYIESSDFVVDFGAGPGAILFNLNCRKKLAVDISATARSYCESTYGLETAPDLSQLADGSVDVVFSNHALEHIPNPIEVLKEIRRVLKKDGRLLLCVPIEDLQSAKQKIWEPNDRDHHLFAWSARLLGNLVSESQFTLIESRYFHFDEPPRLHWSFWNKLPRAWLHAACVLSGYRNGRQHLLAVCR